jgi:hypothetical protein
VECHDLPVHFQRFNFSSCPLEDSQERGSLFCQQLPSRKRAIIAAKSVKQFS